MSPLTITVCALSGVLVCGVVCAGGMLMYFRSMDRLSLRFDAERARSAEDLRKAYAALLAATGRHLAAQALSPGGGRAYAESPATWSETHDGEAEEFEVNPRVGAMDA